MIFYAPCKNISNHSINLVCGKPYNAYSVIEEDWMGCNPCQIVCPVDDCITMEEHRVAPEYVNWLEFQKRRLPLNDH